MAVASEVDDDGVAIIAGLLDFVDQFALDIALEVGDSDVRELFSQGLYGFVHSGRAIYFWLANTSEVEVRAVDDFDCFQ